MFAAFSTRVAIASHREPHDFVAASAQVFRRRLDTASHIASTDIHARMSRRHLTPRHFIDDIDIAFGLWRAPMKPQQAQIVVLIID